MIGDLVKISDACKSVVVGYVGPTSEYYTDKTGIPFLRTQNISQGEVLNNGIKFIVRSLHDKLKKSQLQAGDVILSRVISDKIKCAIVPKEWDGANCANIIIIKPGKSTDSNYLKHYINSPLAQNSVLKLKVGSAQSVINAKVVKGWMLPLPPLEQQKKIAAILDAADTYRQKTKALISKYDELTQSLFLDMFGDPVRNPKGWTMKPLKDFGKIVTGNTPSRKNYANYNDKFIEWIKTNNITTEFTNVTSAKEYLSEEGLLNSRSVKKGSLLVACIAGSIKSIGRAALADRKVAFNQQINAIEPIKNINSTFLYYLFRSSSSYIQSHASNGMKRMLSKGDFQKIKMICPNIDIQNKFAESVQAIESQKAQAQDSLAQAEDLFNSLLQRAFKGELV